MLRSCLFYNSTNITNHIAADIMEYATLPSLVLMSVTLFFAIINLVALINSQYYKCPNASFYMNLTVTDTVMALLGILFLVLPRGNSYHDFSSVGRVLFILRSVWSLSVLFLTINRYRIINVRSSYTISTANILIGLTWTQSILICTFWYLLSPDQPWHDLHRESKLGGVILENVLTLMVAVPVPSVLVLLLMTSYRARQHLARFAEEEERVLLISPQVEGDLKLLHAFGVVYVVGFGLMFVINVNQLLNLGGAVKVVPYWQSRETFCVYMTCSEQVSNMVINFANSVIVLQSRHVRGVLSRVARKITRAESPENERSVQGQSQSG